MLYKHKVVLSARVNKNNIYTFSHLVMISCKDSNSLIICVLRYLVLLSYASSNDEDEEQRVVCASLLGESLGMNIYHTVW